MSEHSDQWAWLEAELTETLDGVRYQAGMACSQASNQAEMDRNRQYAELADIYRSAAKAYIPKLASMTPHLSRWPPDPLRFIQEAAVCRTLYHQGDIHGALQQSYALLSALPGNPGSTPPEVPPPPDD
jgi:hypothetical protein